MQNPQTESPDTENNPTPSIYTDVDKVPLSLLEHMSYRWNIVYKQRKQLHDVSIKRIVLGQVFTIFVVGVVSVLVHDTSAGLLLVGATLILYPSITELLTTDAAVLGATIHHDIDIMGRKRAFKIMQHVMRSVLVAVTSSAIVGSIAGLVGLWLFDSSFIMTLQLAIAAGLIASIIGFPLLAAVTLLARNLRVNPDDVTPPFENTIFNVLVLISIGIASRLIS